MAKNPLFEWFRQPGMHVSLPSNGHYNSPGLIDFSPGKEVAIYPMTAADEIILTNPDSLLNGTALERIIASCCPSVANPRDLTVPDADVIILAAKLVSYGDSFPLQANCPKCKTLKSFSLSIRAVLESVKKLPPKHTVRLNDDLVAYLRPYTLDSNNQINLTQFEQQKLIQNLIKDDIDETLRADLISNAFQKITNLNLDLLSHSILKISTPNGDVTEQDDIKEFIDNVGREYVKKIKDGLEFFNQYGLPKKTPIVCDKIECQHEFEAPIVYDPSSFFV